MNKRKHCITCKEPLMSFQGSYLHPDKPCSGLSDYIDIEATVRDDFLQEKFIVLYGTPRLSDYELLKIYEGHKKLLIEAVKDRDMAINKLLSNKAIKIYLWLKKLFHH